MRTQLSRIRWSVALTGGLVLLASSLSLAMVPERISYEGRLADVSGVAVNGTVDITFSLYAQPDAAASEWSEMVPNVEVTDGAFSVELGAIEPFTPGLFDGPRWLGIAVAPDGEMNPRIALTSSAYALEAKDAETLEGFNAQALDQSLHAQNTSSNPHNVLVEHTGAQAALDALQATVDGLVADLATANQTIAALQMALVDEEAARIAANGTLTDSVNGLSNDLAELGGDVDGIEANSVLALDGKLRLTNDTALFEGVNVQVVSGSGATDGEVNGLGNVIVGYNRNEHGGKCLFDDGRYESVSEFMCDFPPSFGTFVTEIRSGSHNLVVGDQHMYTRFGGLVAGFDNSIVGVRASVSGGVSNTTSGPEASVSGGEKNLASGPQSSVSAGTDNTASGLQSSVTGGFSNRATGNHSSVSGGHGNSARHNATSVSGGSSNTASAPVASLSGGQNNTASGNYSSVSGGRFNTASGEHATVTGGRQNVASIADASYSVENETGDLTATATCPAGKVVLFGFSEHDSLGGSGQDAAAHKTAMAACPSGETACSVTVPDDSGNDEVRVWIVCH